MILLYTFSTFPWIQELKSSEFPVVILQKLTTDLERLKELIEEYSPDLVLGVAVSDNTISYIETKAVNSFHKKKVSKDNSVEEYALHIPKLPFQHRHHATQSFCNWSAFKLCESVENVAQTKISFVHVAKGDIGVLLRELKNRPAVLSNLFNQAD